GRKRELRVGDSIVRPHILQDVVERTKFLLPIADRPRRTVEMADRVRGDLVAAAVKSVHVFDASANLLGRAAKADAGIAPPLVRTFIDAPPAVGDESSGSQFSPPTESDSDSLSVYPITRAN